MGWVTGAVRVLSSSGKSMTIKDVRAGALLVSHRGRPCQVINLQVHEDKTHQGVVCLKIESLLTEIKSTSEHPFLVLRTQDKCIVTGGPLSLPTDVRRRYAKRAKKGAYQMEHYA